jgi:hypothetical protein
MFHILTHRISTVLAILMVCALCYAPLSAQTLDSARADSVQKPRENWYWVQMGAGVATPTTNSYNGNYYIGSSLNVAFENTVLSLRTSALLEGTKGSGQLIDIGGLYGWTSRADWAFSSFAIGLAYTQVPKYESSKDVSYHGPGLIMEAHAVLKAYLVGLGISVVGNLNPVSPYLGATLSFYFGYMPPSQ